MPEGCVHNCLACGKCAIRDDAILSRFASVGSGAKRNGFGVAADVGTTTAVLALMDLSDGTVAARHSFPNPQRAFGADVITRIGAAGAGHLGELQAAIVSALRDGIHTLLDARGADKLQEIVIAGNTAMMYLLLGLPCGSLGAAPFRPAFKLRDTYPYAEIFGVDDLRGKALMDCPVRIVPYIGAFVGGDVTAGLLYAQSEGISPQGTPSRFLLADLGTNGEMALWDDGKLWVASAAAGPAFEGGISGSASSVLDALAHLVREGGIDETGRLREGARSPFTQKQIRDLQLAKSAVRTGVEILLAEAGLAYDALDAVYLAGGIGQALDPQSAVTAGLLPSAQKARAVGNASLGGAAMILLDPDRMGAAKGLARNAQEINLAAHGRFNELFVEYMAF